MQASGDLPTGCPLDAAAATSVPRRPHTGPSHTLSKGLQSQRHAAAKRSPQARNAHLAPAQGAATAAAAALAVAVVGGSCLPAAQAVTTEQLLFLEVGGRVVQGCLMLTSDGFVITARDGCGQA